MILPTATEQYQYLFCSVFEKHYTQTKPEVRNAEIEAGRKVVRDTGKIGHQLVVITQKRTGRASVTTDCAPIEYVIGNFIFL